MGEQGIQFIQFLFVSNIYFSDHISLAFLGVGAFVLLLYPQCNPVNYLGFFFYDFYQ